MMEIYIQGIIDRLEMNFINNNVQLNEDKENIMKYKGITITKRVDNRYQATCNLNDKTKIIYGKTKEECYNNYNKAINNLINYDYDFNTWAKIWYETYKSNNKQSTNTQITGILNLYAKPFFDKKINHISSIEIQQVINSLSKRSAKQAQRLFVTLKDIFTKAYNNRIIEYNPMLAVIRPKYQSKEKTGIDKPTIEKVIESVKNTDIENLVLFCLYQGTRIGEALALNYEDIDFVNSRITINKTNYKEQITSPKTEKSNRIIPLFERTRCILNVNGTGRVFNINYNTAFKHFNSIKKQYGLSNITFHSLRHYFVSECNEIGINTKQISQWVGHSSTKITDQVYTHINKEFEQKQEEILNKFTQKE